MKAYIKCLRPHHWIKNILVFLPVIFNRSLFDVDVARKAVIGIAAFSFAASAIYILNDIMDYEKDRVHPVKCRRPIASGKVKKETAAVMGVVLMFLSLGISWKIAGMAAVVMLFLYAAINICYSMGLKNCPIVDVVILVTGFLLRIFYGSVATGIEISSWLYLTIIAFAFYFGLGKRRNELAGSGSSETRKVLQYYNNNFLDKNMYMCVALGIMFYSLWTIEHTSKFLVWSVPMVLVICMKYSLDIEGRSDGDPVEVLVHDKVLVIMCIVYGLAVLGMLYL
ncbi:MAG: decaprenyl-phosphate phosphoribosyltransferase [Lachnospiraceae bacterium]|nr:decaprenyl-phosphate phosphoribosyltransferase [Lachnospiraceae bacterium]